MSEVLTGSPAGTIYGTYAAAVIYVDGQLGDRYRAWEALSVADRKRALLSAAGCLARQTWIETADTFAERDAITEFVTASYELATIAADDPDALSAADTGSNIARAYAGGAGVDFFNPTIAKFGSATPLPAVIMALVGSYLAGTSITIVGGIAVTGDSENPLSSCSDSDRNDPW